MLITMNDQTLAADFSHLANLEELLAEIHDKHLPAGQHLYQVHLNGEFFSERYPGEARYFGIHEIERLEVKTLPEAEMVRTILKEAVGQGGILAQAVAKCAHLFRVAPEEEANRCFAQVLEALQWLLHTGEGGVQALLRESAGALPDPQARSGFFAHLQKLLTDMEELAVQEDYIMLADLMEFELHPLVEQWRTLILNLVQS